MSHIDPLNCKTDSCCEDPCYSMFQKIMFVKFQRCLVSMIQNNSDTAYARKIIVCLNSGFFPLICTTPKKKNEERLGQWIAQDVIQ